MSSTTATNSSANAAKLAAAVAVVLVIAGSVIGGVCGTGRCKTRTAPSPAVEATALTATNGRYL